MTVTLDTGEQFDNSFEHSVFASGQQHQIEPVTGDKGPLKITVRPQMAELDPSMREGARFDVPGVTMEKGGAGGGYSGGGNVPIMRSPANVNKPLTFEQNRQKGIDYNVSKLPPDQKAIYEQLTKLQSQLEEMAPQRPPLSAAEIKYNEALGKQQAVRQMRNDDTVVVGPNFKPTPEQIQGQQIDANERILQAHEQGPIGPMGWFGLATAVPGVGVAAKHIYDQAQKYNQSHTEPVIDTSHDVVSGAVASKNENKVYIDPSIPKEFHPFLAVHETHEKACMAGGGSYDECHKDATMAEKQAVERAGMDWDKYVEKLDPYVAKDTEKEAKNPPPDPHIDPKKAIDHHANKAEALEKADRNIAKEEDTSMRNQRMGGGRPGSGSMPNPFEDMSYKPKNPERPPAPPEKMTEPPSGNVLDLEQTAPGVYGKPPAELPAPAKKQPWIGSSPWGHGTIQKEEQGSEKESFTDWFKRLFSPPQTPTSRPFPSIDEAEFAQKYGMGYAKSWEKFFNDEEARILGKTGFKLVPAGKAKVRNRQGKIEEVADAYKAIEKFEPASAAGMNDDSLMNAVDIPSMSKIMDLKDPENKEIAEKLKGSFARASLAVNRSAIAELGFNPQRTMMDVKIQRPTVLGMTDDTAAKYKVFGSPTDRIYASAIFPSTIVHESIHNGLEHLTVRNPQAKEIYERLASNVGGGNKFTGDEHIVRYLMHTIMGNPEMRGHPEYTGEQQIAHAKYWFEESRNYKQNQKDLHDLEALAQQEVASKRPMGPR